MLDDRDPGVRFSMLIHVQFSLAYPISHITMTPAALTVGQGIGNLRSDDAHEDHGQPISPRDVLPRSELQEQRSDQQSRHDAICQGGSETDMHRQVARTGLAHSSRHDLDDPEDKRDFPGLCSA
jgi:hypothetical protein